MPVSTTTWVTALAFGVLLGIGVVRSREDRVVGIGSVVVLLTIGIVTWLAGPEDRSEHALAAVGMTFAGASATAVASMLSRRDP